MINIRNEDIKNKTVLIREDFNVPMIHKKILNINKILLSIPCIKFFLKNQVKLVIISHLGNPKKNNNIKLYSLRDISKVLSILLRQTVYFSSNNSIKKININPGEIVLLENTRFIEGEKICSIKISKLFTHKIDIFIFNAFASSHRFHASTYGITKFIKKKYIGVLLEKEMSINKFLIKEKKNISLIMGGCKIKNKINLISNFFNKKYSNYILFGSKLSNKLMCEIKIINSNNINKIIISQDFIFDKKNIKDNKKILDIGHKSIKKYIRYISQSKTILWNGPLGLFENKEFEIGTKCILNFISYNKIIFSIIGGGDTALAIEYFNLKKNISYISTGGGALLSFFSKENIYAL